MVHYSVKKNQHANRIGELILRRPIYTKEIVLTK